MEMEDRLEAGSLIRLVKTDSLTAQAFSLKCRYVLGRKDDCLKIIGPNIEEISRVTLRHDKNMTFGGWLAWNEAQSSLVLSHSADTDYAPALRARDESTVRPSAETFQVSRKQRDGARYVDPEVVEGLMVSAATPRGSSTLAGRASTSSAERIASMQTRLPPT